MNRLDRRIRILRGKRETGVYDPDQHWLGDAVRSRAARKVRTRLRRLDPVVLITPRWSLAPRFLDDLATDLAIGQPGIESRSLSLAPLQGRSVPESWAWLAQAVVEFCGLAIDGPVAQAVSRHGFRSVMSSLFRRSCGGPRRALLVHGMEYLHVEARDDLIQTFEGHVEEAGHERRITLLLAGSVDTPMFDVKGAARIVLPDYGHSEAIETLAEYVGPVERHRLEMAVGLVGGVPALLDRLGSEAAEAGRLSVDREALWRALGSLADEVRGAVAIVSAVDGLADRLDEVSRDGALPEDQRWDRMLVRAGVFAIEDGAPRRVSLRAPLFAELAGAR